MHIGLVSPSWPPSKLANGIVTYTSQLREGLVTRGHRVTVFAPGASDENHPCVVRNIGPLPVMTGLLRRALRKPTETFDGGAAIAQAIRSRHRQDPLDVVEMEETFGFVSEVQRSLPIPVVVKLHGPGFLHLMQGEIDTEFGRRRIAAEGAALAQMQWITAPSRWTLEQTLKRFSLQPRLARVVANPLAWSHGSPPWEFNRERVSRLLFVGRFDLVKGADVLFAAFSQLAERNPDLHLDFVGPDTGLSLPDGTNVHIADYMERTLRPEVRGRVIYHGFLERAAIETLRAQCSVTVVPSRQESQGYTAVEAMLQGCPVVCSDSSGLDELIDDGVTGLKARTGDGKHFAMQIQRVLDSSDLAQGLGRSARECALGRHASSAVVDQTIEVYRIAVSRG